MPENPRYIPTAEEKKNFAFLLTKRSIPQLERITTNYIEKITGKKWNDETILEKIRDAVLSQKESYWKEGEKRTIAYRGAYSILSYMVYQMPGYVHEVTEFFGRLIIAGLIRKKIRALDVGSGVGTATIGMIRALTCFPEMQSEITAVEQSDTAREAYAFVVPEIIKNLKSTATIGKQIGLDVTKELPDGKYDVIICANLINELSRLDLSDKTKFLVSLSEHLTPDGNLIVLEPADLNNAIQLRKIACDAKEKGLTIYAPCNDIRGVPCKVSPCWTFCSYADIKPTKLMYALGGEKEKYRFVNTDVKFSYAIFRIDGHRKCGYRIPPDAKRARLSQIKRHVGKRIHVTVSVMSNDIGDKKNYLYLVCDGTGTVPCYLALPAFHRTPEHEALLTASYGSVVAVDSVLVLYNEKQNAYNLLLGKNSYCRMIAGTATGIPCPNKGKELKKRLGLPQKR
ncbi:MAG TPA: class I SAM-dependent methyltransferase [Methanocorpusculum sp.]|nr:class I SAM-dependent methyltransferase [Methanocorpusculum sp.]